jgi:hypothetical protein
MDLLSLQRDLLDLKLMFVGLFLAVLLTVVVFRLGTSRGWTPIKSAYVANLSAFPLTAASLWLLARVWWMVPLALLGSLAAAGYFTILYRFSVSDDGQRLRESLRKAGRGR